MKKVLWTALITAASMAGMALAERVTARLWRKAAREPPPPIPGWARLVVGRSVKKRVRKRIHAPVA